MRITALMENTTAKKGFLTEHGLSLYIETDCHKILFDTGQSGAFLENAEALGISLKDVDTAILSHGHFDHSGGLKEFLKVNRQAKVYVREGAFTPHFNALGKYIGVDPELKANPRIVLTGGHMVLDHEIRLETYNQEQAFLPVQSYGMTEEENGLRRPDPFRHEQYLILTEGNKKALFSGCSHKGIYNLVQWTALENLNAIVGGFHFMKLLPEEYGEMDQTAEKLLEYPIQYYTCHCTGIPQYEYLKTKMPEVLHYISAGQTIEI